MKLWIVPVAVVVLICGVAAAVVVLPTRWAFLSIATCLVIGLGAAPVAFAVHTRRVEIRQREEERERTGRGHSP